MKEFTLKRTSSSDTDFKALVILLDDNLREINGELQAEYDDYNLLDYIETVVVAYKDSVPVGCGCFKNFDKNTAEIKRMYTVPDQRGKGIAAAVLNELELWAKALGFAAAVLETGKKHHDALYLYQKLGYVITENYEPYVEMDESVCMRKRLV